MTLRQITLSNMMGLRRKYAGFLLCSVMAVILFYMLASFVMHPDVTGGYISAAQMVTSGLVVAEFIIVTFLFLFVLYSSTAFVRSRKKEFGLLCLLGASKSQVSRIIVFEHVVIVALSIAAGLGLGIPASKLMLIAMEKMLQVSSPVRFMIVKPAVTLTAVVFATLYIVIGFLTTLQISPRKVVRMLREHQRPKALPSYSVIVSILAILCLGVGYGVAWKVDGMTVILAMLPVTAIVSLGTYLLFREVSVAVLRSLQRRPSVFYRGTNPLLLGDLIFRMKENSMVLATVAVLSASIITATGTFYTAQATLLKDEERAYPHAVTATVIGEESRDIEDEINRILRDRNIAVTEEVVLSGLLAELDDYTTLIAPERLYNEWAGSAGHERISLDETEALLLRQYLTAGGETTQVTVSYGEKSAKLNATELSFPRTNYAAGITNFAVVDDDMFASLSASAAESDRLTVLSYEFLDWRKSLQASREIQSSIPEDRLFGFVSRVQEYQKRKSSTSIAGMIALAVTALFFISSGSILYFRLFGEIEEDREKYKSMRRLGVSQNEIGHLVTAQILTIFFVPIAVGSSHCLFAMKALSNVLRDMPWPFLGVFRYAIAAILGFSGIQVIFFLAARHAYLKEIGQMKERVA